MIVDSMTYDEILELFKKDKRIIDRKLEENTGKVRRWVAKLHTKERAYYPPLRFQSAAGFHYVVVIYYKGREATKTDIVGMISYCWYIQKRGMYAIVNSTLSRMYNHYTIIHPHFLDRYRERFLKDLAMPKEDALHHFIMNNLKQPSRNIESEKYPGCHYKVCNDGLSLCRKLNDLDIEAKTFISWDMAGEDQKAIALEGKKIAERFDVKMELDFEDGVE